MLNIQVNWQPTTEERYWEMLEILPPAAQTGYGFLVGEPADHRRCEVKGVTLPRYDAFIETEAGFFTADRPLTFFEFKEAARP